MKKIITSAFIIAALMASVKVSAQQNVGIGTTTPNASARLDITATNRGLLIPRVALTGLADATTVPTPATSLLVFNTNAAVTGGTGFYYNNGTAAAPSWVKLGSGGSGGSGWALTGNAATDSTANFIGTTDAKPLVFRVNNGFAGQIGTRGGLSLGRGANGTSRITPPNVIAIGDSALFRNRDSASLAIGNHAMFNNNDIFPSENIAIGDFSLFSNTIGFRNTAIGRFALSFVDTAANNTAVGYRALMFNEAEENTAIGSFSQLFDSTGTDNSSLGASSLRDNVVGDFNTAVGAFASVLGQVASGNTSVGTFALASNDANLNTGVGFQSLVSNFDGENNTAVGGNSLLNNTSGFSNVAVGSDALSINALGSLNVAVGNAALSAAEGNENTAVGNEALVGLGAGEFNTAVGSGAGGTGDFDNTVALGAGATVTASNTIAIGNSAITSIRGQVNFSTFSDGRYKTDVEENVKGLDFIMQLRPVTYHYNFGKIRGEQQHTGTFGAKNITAKFLPGLRTAKGDMSLQKGSFKPGVGSTKSIRLKGHSSNATLDQYYSEVNENDQIRYTGFIAQEVEAAAKKTGFEFSGVDKPQNDKDHYALRYSEFVVPLVKAVQEQQAVIESQNKKIEDLTRRLQALEQR